MSSPAPPPHAQGPTEATHYYFGLSSQPILVARSSTTEWKPPTGPESAKRLSPPPGNHPIGSKPALTPEIINYLDSKSVKWTSIDIVKIGCVEEHDDAPVVYWIGVLPGSLSREDGRDVVLECLNILTKHDIEDVEVEIRESIVKRWGSGCE
ncbi:hypothetical protein PENSPDRAFT_658128 [Peniophora sp. CONT]|nr:hypothetical protein PENSPDRAFT_658128 [Peniophora sp. CONT]